MAFIQAPAADGHARGHPGRAFPKQRTRLEAPATPARVRQRLGCKESGAQGPADGAEHEEPGPRANGSPSLTLLPGGLQHCRCLQREGLGHGAGEPIRHGHLLGLGREKENKANNPKQLPLYILYLKTDVRACLSFSPELFLLFLNLAVPAGDVAKRARPAAPSLLGVTLPGLPCSEAEVARLHSFLTLGQVRIFTPR